MKYLEHCEMFTDYIRNQLLIDQVIQNFSGKELKFEPSSKSQGNTKREHAFKFFNNQFNDHSQYEEMLKTIMPKFILESIPKVKEGQK